MPTSPRSVSVERVIPAPADKIFAVLADPAQHPVIDGSGTVRKSRSSSPARLSLGSRFGMNMKAGVPYVISNKVVEFDEDRRIAWRHFARNIWRYELEPVDSGTLVRETFDWNNPLGPFTERMGFPAKNKVAMERTLERLERFVTTGSAD